MYHSFDLVFVWETNGKRRAIGDVERAAQWLLDRWPEEFSTTLAHRAARIACLEALEGRVESGYARVAFIVAAREADILVE